MFSCNHNGRCCEDPTTQISLTLGDIQRMCIATEKSAVQLYEEGIIGIFPFGDPESKTAYELDVGLYIPCKHRKEETNCGKKTCAIYELRPLNCRLFPFWLVAQAPKDMVENFIEEHPCGKCMGKISRQDKMTYKHYTNALAQIFDEEEDKSAPFFAELFKKHNIEKSITARESISQEETKEVILELVHSLQQKEYTSFFKDIDEELQNHLYELEIPTIDNFQR